MTTQINMEKVTIEVPKTIRDSSRSVEVSPEEYLQHSLLTVIKTDFESTSEVWGCSVIFKRYGLERVFKAMKPADQFRLLGEP